MGYDVNNLNKNIEPRFNYSTQQMHNEKMYEIGLSSAKAMLNSGYISEYDYTRIDTILANKYRPILGGLCC